jgi:hypothetical protein
MARPTRNQTQRIEALIAQFSPRIRDAFIAAIQAQASSVNITALIQALEIGDTFGAARLLELPQGLLFPLQEEIRAAMMAGGALAELPRVVQGVFAFNGRHPRAEEIVRDLGAVLIQGIQQDTLEAARNVITQGMEENRGFRSIALDIVGRRGTNGQREGGILGLTTQQTDAVMNARAILSNPDRLAEYFNADGSPRYKLSDRRFDGLVRKAIAGKAKLTQGDIDRIVNAHKSKALKYRGDLIGKTESRSAIAQGQYESYQQMAEDPRIDRVELTWSHGLSREPRLSHVQMNGVKVQLGQRFDVPADGTLPAVSMLYPHDPAAPAEHTLNCRCVAIYRAVPAIRD